MMDDVCYHHYRRGVTAQGELLGHANKLGINLRSQSIPVTFPAKQRSRKPGSPWSPRPDPVPSTLGGIGNLSYSRISSAKRSGTAGSARQQAPAYIHNLVIPLNTVATDGGSLLTPYASQSSIYRVKSANTIPSYATDIHMAQSHPTAPNSRAQSSYKLPHPSQTSSQREYSSLGHVTSQSSLGSASSPGRKSGQSLRFDTEQTDLSKCRTRKRTSEIRPHRVDRMYYMTGSTLNVKPKHHVENDELLRLREMSRARTESQQISRAASHHRGDQYIPDSSTRGEPLKNELNQTEPPMDPADNGAGQNDRPEDLDSVSEGPLTRNQTPGGEAGNAEGGDSAGDAIALSQQLDDLGLEGGKESIPGQQEQNGQLENEAADQQNTQDSKRSLQESPTETNDGDNINHEDEIPKSNV